MTYTGDTRIIFLDIDGVLNTDRSVRMNHDGDRLDFDHDALEQLTRIVNETGAKIVITSTWRIHREHGGFLWAELLRNLNKAGLENSILDITPVLDDALRTADRWKEIADWLKHDEHNIYSYVILDDEWQMGELNNRFLRCPSYSGITSEIAGRAIRLLHTSIRS